MAALALDSEYPASDTMITSRIITSSLLIAIRYILPMLLELHAMQLDFNCDSSVVDVRVLYVARNRSSCSDPRILSQIGRDVLLMFATLKILG
ncbi:MULTISPECIES: hypothetical protein [Rhizobium]|uniref:hypothetical protein n=1 Tax=Rhizobium TaxID=379 RepID=UPI001427D405|nr:MULTISPECIES: hypothetical protein [Rhizobium]MBY3168406.1 hypothetical protein [Rhizobium laguerreae]MBY3344670.1 hypothetical protein [Rhizobium laguerreae]MBY3351703.1 hypothetical protein [Rhizobium laguerreae]MBY3374134.1 hypothetical protein [Rhizobium laguerreae]MBY3389911.1 hypothetical protein [Rhizobium laguerreae]